MKKEKTQGKKKEIVVIVGPTASGKTRLSLDLAAKFEGEIISADSMQIYFGMDIGTAKVKKEEMQGIPHHLLSYVDPRSKYSVADYQEEATEKIHEIKKRGKIPFLVGGTGLYIKAVLEGLNFFSMDIDWSWREKKAREAEIFGNEKLHNELRKIDPEMAKKIHPNDVKRIIRGLEIYRLTGEIPSVYRRKAREQGERFSSLKIGLSRNREELYQRIEERVEKMFEEGLVEEVKNLVEQGCNSEMTSMQGLGYKEIMGYLQGEYDLNRAKYLIKRNTRRYAKRQLTWFKRDREISWYNLSEMDYGFVLQDCIKKIKENFF